MAIPNSSVNCNSENPFQNPPAPIIRETEPDLLYVANKGVALVTAITKYLSTLPHPIEIVEELVAVCAVTSTLLTSLHGTIQRFPHLALSRTHSFVAPLCYDALFAFKLLGSKVEEARRLRIFEPNNVGLVRLPKVAWTLVMGTEAKVAALRSRLYVEKYRVRVLIEAVSWAGLASLEPRTERQNEELEQLQKMLPLIAERLIGVQKDYVPRLRARLGQAPPPPPEVKAEVVNEVKTEQPNPPAVLNEDMEHVNEKEPLKLANAKLDMRSASTDSFASTSSSASSTTAFDDSIYETWLLRYNPQRKTINRTTSIFGIPIHNTHTITAANYYVKPVSSCLSEIKDLRRQCQGIHSESEHRKKFSKTILGMHDDAQWEIQRLIEAREKATSGESVKRVWSVVAFMERPRRSIATPLGRKWYNKTRKESVEWVMVLKGETLDHRCRAMPGKHEDPWNPRPEPAARLQAQVQPQVQAQAQQQVSAVLRHVENRKAMSAEEAKRTMDEIVDELFAVQD